MEDGTPEQAVVAGSASNEQLDAAHNRLVEHDAGAAEEIVKAIFFGSGLPFSSEDKGAPYGPDKSRVLPVDSWERMACGEYIAPLANPDLWSLTTEQNTRLGRCVRSFARNVVGLGYELVYRDPTKTETDPEEKKLADAEMAQAKLLFESPNDDMPFTLLMEAMKIDEETIGNGWLEIVRNRANKVIALYHVPGTTVRWKKDLSGYIQIRGIQKRYFKCFGDMKPIDARTGRPFEGKVDRAFTATELLQFRIYSTRSSYYGVPRYIACAPAIAGNRFAAIRNVSFFENDAVPRMLITINGGTLDEESLEDLRKFFERHHKGVANAHRVAIVQATPRQQVLGRQTSPVIRAVPLTVGNGEDGSFLRYSQATNEEIREAFGLSEAFFQSYNINRASAQTGIDATNKQELDPDRVRIEYVLNHKLIWGERGLGLKRIKLQFKRNTMVSDGEKAVVDGQLSAAAALTPNEIRQRQGLPPYPESYTFANKPLAIAMAELQLGIAMAFAGTKPPPPAAAAVKKIYEIMKDMGLDSVPMRLDLNFDAPAEGEPVAEEKSDAAH